MLGLSDAARQAIIDGNVAARGRVNLYEGGSLLRADVPLDARRPSEVRVDGTAATLRTATLNFAPDVAGELVPLLPLASGPLAPYSVEAWCYVDLTLPGGTVETLAQGVFGLRKSAADDAGGQVVSASARDRSQRVIDASLTAPYDVADGVNMATAIRALIDDGVPGLTYVGFDPVDTPHAAVGLHFAAGDDRWKRATEMAASVGKRLYFDTVGQPTLAPVPDPSAATSTWTYDEGPDGIVVGLAQELDADNTYSHAYAIAQPADPFSPPLRSDAYDDDPASPTYWQGPFGDRAVKMESGYLATQAQTDEAVAALLRTKKGLNENLTATAMAVYAHEDSDVVQVVRAALGIDAYYVLSQFPVPLGPGTSAYTMRSRRIL